MKKYLLISSIVFTILIILFFIAETLHVPFLADNSFASLTGWHISLIGVLLLAIDVLVPVPSSLVMITLGCTMGFFWGAVWSFIGIMAAALFGFFLGRTAQPLMRHFINNKDRERTNSFINRWGMIGIIATRPMPLFSETTVLIAGTTDFSWKKLIIASTAGNLPIALLYAWTGSASHSMNNGVWSFLFAIGVAGMFWLVNYLIAARQNS